MIMSKNKIYDCITFFDENLLVNSRFEILKDVVDYFVICESNYDHKGNKKKINFKLHNQKLKDLIPRHNFMIPVQAAIGGKIIARETIKGFKKDILTKIHGGGARDRKRKLLDKQKKGKARGKQFGKVEIPQEAFIGVLKINKDQ